MRKQVETWQRSELTDVTAKVVIYEAFIEGKLEVSKHLAVCMTSISSRDTKISGRGRSGACRMRLPRAFKELDPIPQFKATAKMGEFLEARFSRSF